MTYDDGILKMYRLLLFAMWAIIALCSFGILSTYAIIGTAHIANFLKISGDSLGYAFLAVTLYSSQWALGVYILITSLQWYAFICGEDISRAVNWIGKFRLTRIPENKGEL